MPLLATGAAAINTAIKVRAFFGGNASLPGGHGWAAGSSMY